MSPTASPAPPLLRHIVHASDGTTAGEAAFAHALRLAVAAASHLVIAHVATSVPDEDAEWAAFPGVRGMLIRWGMLPADASQADVGRRLGLRVAKVALVGRDPAKALDHLLTEHACSLMVLATHARQGLDRLLHGSVAEAIARRVQTPILLLPIGGEGFVVPATGTVGLRNILIPVDRATPSAEALAAGFAVADALGATDALIHLLHVGAAEEAPLVTVAPEQEARLRRISGSGGVVAAILEAAAAVPADLIVMATRGHDSLLDALRGSTTEQVLREADRPVLAVPV